MKPVAKRNIIITTVNTLVMTCFLFDKVFFTTYSKYKSGKRL